MQGHLLVAEPKLSGKIEIVRSFSYKLNTGNYESRDFFCSQRAECKPAEAERVSELLYDFCKRQVMKAVQQYRQEQGQTTTTVQRRTA